MATGVRLRHQDLSCAFTSRSQDDKMATGTGLEAERSVLHLLSRAGQEAANTGLFYHQQDLQKHAATEYSTTAECSLLVLLSVCLPRVLLMLVGGFNVLSTSVLPFEIVRCGQFEITGQHDQQLNNKSDFNAPVKHVKPH